METMMTLNWKDWLFAITFGILTLGTIAGGHSFVAPVNGEAIGFDIAHAVIFGLFAWSLVPFVRKLRGSKVAVIITLVLLSAIGASAQGVSHAPTIDQQVACRVQAERALQNYIKENAMPAIFNMGVTQTTKVTSHIDAVGTGICFARIDIVDVYANEGVTTGSTHNIAIRDAVGGATYAFYLDETVNGVTTVDMCSITRPGWIVAAEVCTTTGGAAFFARQVTFLFGL